MNKKIFIIAPVSLMFGALVGCKGGNNPTPTPEVDLEFKTRSWNEVSDLCNKL